MSFPDDVGNPLLRKGGSQTLRQTCLCLFCPTEGRATGIPKNLQAMRRNGSPPPEFEFDDGHTFFMCRLPVHPEAKWPLVAPGTESPPESGTPVPPQVEAQVEAQVELRILAACAGAPLSSAEIASALGHAKLSGNLRKALPRLRQSGMLEYTIPDKPNSRLQKYRLTTKGQASLATKEGT